MAMEEIQEKSLRERVQGEKAQESELKKKSSGERAQERQVGGAIL